MTLLGKIFRPWDLATNETFVSKSNDNETNHDFGGSDEALNVREKSSPVPITSPATSFRERKTSTVSSTEEETETTNHEKLVRRCNPLPSTELRSSSATSSHPVKVEDSGSSSSSSNHSRSGSTTTLPHFLELNHAAGLSVPPFYIPSSPVGSSPTTPNFMSSSSINELASLSRSELTAMGLLPPEPPASMKVKRQRPKRFRCPHCQVAFSNNGQLRGHIRIHTGERPFACEHEGCGKSFTRNEELTRHRRIHTGLRPYPCTHCGKKFGRKDHLKKHTRTHQRPMYNASLSSSGMIGLGNPFHPFNPSLIPSHSAINEFGSTASPYALPFMLSIPPPISHFPFS